MLAVSGIRQLREANTRLAAIPAKPVFRADRPASKAAPRVPRSAPPTPEPAAPAPPEAAEPARSRSGLKKRRVPPGGHPVPKALDAKTQGEALSLTLAYMQASLEEWGMSMDDLDDISVRRCEGVMSAAERRSRL